MPRSESPRISRSCAADRIRRIMCIRRASCVLPVIGIADHNTLAGVVRAYKELGNPDRHRQAKAFDRLAPRLYGRHAGYPGLSARPRGLWPAVPVADPRQARRRFDRIDKGECHLDLDDLLEFSEGQLLVLTLPHRFETAKALGGSGSTAAQPRGWRVACGEPAVPRRRPAPPGRGCMVSPPRPACRCWRPMRCCITIPRGVRCRMS